MTTPPAPGPGGSSNPWQGLTGSLQSLVMQLQAFMHQNQTLNNLPSSALNAVRQARQNVLNPQALMGGQLPAPFTPTTQWLQQTAASFLSQVVLNQAQQPSSSASKSNPGRPAAPAPATPTSATPAQGPAPAATAAPAVMPSMYSPYGMPYPYMYGSPYGGAMPYNGPMPGPFPGQPLVAPTFSGGGGSHGGTGIGRWTQRALPMIGMRVGGPWGAVAGAAVAAAAKIPAEIRSQRDKNAFYQSIEGGSNFDGFGERLHEEVYRWSTPMVFSSSEARAAFKGVTKLGYNSKVDDGIGRQEALDFIYHGKTRRGQSVDESLQQLQVNSKNALGSLNDLNDALNAVSDSAGKAGVNSQMARAEFTQLMDTAIKSGFGSSAAKVAEAEERTKLSYGRAFQDVDVSERLGMNHAYMASSMAGISVSQYLTGGVTAKLAADARFDRASARTVLKAGVEDWIKQQLAKSGGDVDEATATAIAEDMLRTFYPGDPYALAAAVAMLSGQPDLGSDPVKAAVWVIQQFDGKGAGGEAKKMTAEDKKRQKEISEKNKVDTTTTRERAMMNHYNPSKLDGLDSEHHGGFLGIGGSNSKAFDAYRAWQEKTDGHQDPVIHHLLNAIKGDDKTKVAVTTKDGKKVVSLADAITRHRNELASGQAIILGEKGGKGRSVADILGKDKVDPLRDFSKEASAVDKSGESFAEWEKKHTVTDKNGKQKLEISLTAEARRLLTVLDTTGVAGSSATAQPPLSPWPSNPSYQE